MLRYPGLWLLVTCKFLTITHSAIVPPPWSNPSTNPCATMPGGWQLLYWPPLKKCFKIFQKGYPCPETMELSPIGSGYGANAGTYAECRCPPGTAQSPLTNECHKLFERGPCDFGQYFAPIADVPDRNARQVLRKVRNL